MKRHHDPAKYRQERRRGQWAARPMSPFMIWIGDNLIAVLFGGLEIAAAMLLSGALATWKTARRLRHSPRPVIRFLLSLVHFLTGAESRVRPGRG